MDLRIISTKLTFRPGFSHGLPMSQEQSRSLLCFIPAGEQGHAINTQSFMDSQRIGSNSSTWLKQRCAQLNFHCYLFHSCRLPCLLQAIEHTKYPSLRSLQIAILAILEQGNKYARNNNNGKNKSKKFNQHLPWSLFLSLSLSFSLFLSLSLSFSLFLSLSLDRKSVV